MILVDYRCAQCLGRFEARVVSPPPPTQPCPACRTQAHRAWSPIGLGGRAAGRSATDAPPVPSAGTDPLCVRNPRVPGICHLDPGAARTLLARATGDNRGLERELASQERAVREGTVTAPGTGGHQHAHVPTATAAGGSHAQ